MYLDGGVLGEVRVDLAEFNAEAADLYLIIRATHALGRTVRQVAVHASVGEPKAFENGQYRYIYALEHDEWKQYPAHKQYQASNYEKKKKGGGNYQ